MKTLIDNGLIFFILKKIIMRLATTLLLALLLLVSCGKDDETPAEEPKTGNCLTAVINGEEFTAQTTIGTAVTTTIDYETLGTQETRLLTIIGTIPNLSGDTKSINIIFACSEFTSDLDLVNSDSDCGVGMNYQVTSFNDPNSSIVAAAIDEGTINIQEVTNEKIKGTFTFKGEDQNGTAYNITNGFFDTTIN